MSYILGGITLPNPKKFTRTIIEDAVENILITGKTTKRYFNRKEQYILEYSYLTQAQIGVILSLYTVGLVKSFEVNETSLSIGPTDVLVDISNRNFPPSGELYLEDIVVTLTEVQ